MALSIYKLVIDDTQDTGVNYMALVDDPAIMVNWQAFNNQKQFFANEERRIISGAAMIPDVPIFRRNKEFGEHYVVFDADTIERIVLKFFKNNFINNVNAMHSGDAELDGITMIESYFLDAKRGKITPEEFGEQLPDGTWWTSYKVDNDVVWNEFIKTGKFKGFSVEGFFNYKTPENTNDDELIEEVLNALIR